MLRLFTTLFVLVSLSGCATTGGNADMPIEDKVMAAMEAYHDGKWKRLMSFYDKDAEIYYNSDKNPLSPKEAIAGSETSVEPLMRYHFDRDSMIVESFVDDAGSAWVVFYGVWEGQFQATKRTIRVPTHVRYRFEGGKIVEEHGYWPDHVARLAYEEAAGQ